ncbi:hypothetical protein [Vibrio fluvialis]|uniref:hypothetical protein n=1 Tax=Vibrio fluvialis TaxID=676 RepID=UPI0023A9E0D4|nr:hypothetical protein [Vibrio fluvialis]MDE5179017.1 hypothetical protein [Vibrio fluvialis]
MIKLKNMVIVVIAALSAAGCADSMIGEPNQEVVKHQEDIRSFLKEQFQYDQKQWGYNEGIDILGDTFSIRQTQALPPIFDTPANIGKGEKIAFEDVLEKINKYYQQFGVVVTVAQDADNYLTNRKTTSDATASNSADSTTQSTSTAIMPIQQIATSTLNSNKESSRLNYTMTMDFKNTTLRQMLDLVTANLGLWWEYKNGVVYLRYTTEKTFALDVGDKSYTLSTSPNGTATYSVTTASDSESPLVGLQRQIGQFLSTSGTMAVNKFDKTVTVKDTPLHVARIEQFVKYMNDRAMTTYSLKTEVYQVVWDLNDNKQLDFDISFADSMASLTGSAPTIANTTNFGGIVAQRIGGKWDGSKLIANFVHNNSSLYSKITNTGITKNNIPVQLLTGEDQAIVSGRSVTLDSNGFAKQDIQTKLITEGFSIIGLPRLASNGMVDMEMIINTSNIKDVKAFGDDSDQLQLEEMKRNGLIGSVPVRSGETTVLNAYTRDLTQGEINSLGEAFPWWTGGGKSKRRYQTSVVVLITPVIMDMDR